MVLRLALAVLGAASRASSGSDATTGATTTLPSGFQETVAISGLENPTTLRFASDGRVFVAEKSGVIKVFDGLDDTEPGTFADLRTEVDNYWDRGLLGLALDPGFPATPYVYVLYTYDAPPGGTAPSGTTRVRARPARRPMVVWSAADSLASPPTATRPCPAARRPCSGGGASSSPAIPWATSSSARTALSM